MPFNKIKNLWKKISLNPTKLLNKFKDNIFNEVILPPEDRLCASIAEESYHEPSTRIKTLQDFFLDEKNSSKWHCIYQNPQTKICIIGYRGTIITNIKDIASDAQIILGIQGIDPRVQEALQTYDTIRREYQGFKIRVCGHSLGGTLSYITAKHRNPDRCVVFNPGVSINTFFLQMLQDTIQKSLWTQNTYTYKITGDIISAVGYVGHVKTFLIKSGDPLSRHLMKNFLI